MRTLVVQRPRGQRDEQSLLVDGGITCFLLLKNGDYGLINAQMA